MTRAILFAALSFLVSAAATTGVMVKLHVPAVDSVAATPGSLAAAPRDSSAADSTTAMPRDSIAVGAEAVDTTAPAPSPVPATPRLAATPVTTRPGPDPEATAAAYKQVARVLSAMKPPQAAQVLSQLSDDEVEGILRAVGPRQAADFLANLSVERAGVLSRRLLVPGTKGPAR
jgi:hypothetical protein